MCIRLRLVLLLGIGMVSLDAGAKAKMDSAEATCGQEIAADAEVPEKLARLMRHVATNMETHANWVGASAGGKKEQDALMAVARAYGAIADAAAGAARAMRSMKDIPAVAHDPARLDRAGQARWMRAKIEMQLEFAQLLLRHAEISKKVLATMEAATVQSEH
jgi:hypothetical protein